MINAIKLSRQNYHQKNDIRMHQCVVENFINRGQAEPRLRIHKSKISGFEKLAFKRGKVRAGMIYENGVVQLQIWRNFTPSDLAATTKMWAL